MGMYFLIAFSGVAAAGGGDALDGIEFGILFISGFAGVVGAAFGGRDAYLRLADGETPSQP
jgi:hypothetical protein